MSFFGRVNLGFSDRFSATDLKLILNLAEGALAHGKMLRRASSP